MPYQVIMPGSCGELVQGVLDGIDFHITCPVDRYSRVTAAMAKGGRIIVPDGLSKTALAAERVLERIGGDHGVVLDVESDLPHGKGAASSTADIAATVTAIYGLLGVRLNVNEIAQVALSIEPTDGTFFDGIVAFDHRAGERFEHIGEAPPLEIVVLEPPETLDTIAFNGSKQALDTTDAALVMEAYAMAVEGIRSKNLRLVGEAATLSAITNQRLLYKPELEDIIRICRNKGGVGVNVAHSGTVLGMLVEAGFGRRLFERIAHYVPRAWDAYVVSMINGGARVFEHERSLISVS